MRLTDADVQEIIRLLDASDYDELEIETERFRLVLRREGAGPVGWTQRRETRAQPHVVEAADAARPSAGETSVREDPGQRGKPFRHRWIVAAPAFRPSDFQESGAGSREP